MRAIASRDFSPPESARIRLSTSSPENWNAPARARSEPSPSWGKSLWSCSMTVRSGSSTSSDCCAKYPNVQAGPQAHASGIGRTRAGDHFEQRGLARPVPSHHRPTLSPPDGQTKPFIDHPPAVAFMHILHHHHLVAAARRDAELELHHLAFLRQLDLLD